MQLHELKPKTKSKKKKRIGRGGKRGTFCGRGVKGQKARAGGTPRPALRDIVKKIPKKRGYRFKPIKPKPQAVNLRDIDRHFKVHQKVNPQTLLKKGLIRKLGGRMPKVKILGDGKLTKKLIIENCSLSKSAEKALGKIKKK